jgi:hypothetical protein
MTGLLTVADKMSNLSATFWLKVRVTIYKMESPGFGLDLSTIENVFKNNNIDPSYEKFIELVTSKNRPRGLKSQKYYDIIKRLQKKSQSK